eukprot:scaffold179124_cov23-Tisochrysis_lutea.AAC.1
MPDSERLGLGKTRTSSERREGERERGRRAREAQPRAAPDRSPSQASQCKLSPPRRRRKGLKKTGRLSAYK